MKNKALFILLSLTLAFSTFVAGFYVGKNSAATTIEISAQLSPSPSSKPTAPAATSPAAPSPTSAPVPTQPVGIINLNTATLEQLDTLPGIGPVLAQRILDYRREIGRYKTVEELLEVSGIGEKTLNELRAFLTV